VIERGSTLNKQGQTATFRGSVKPVSLTKRRHSEPRPLCLVLGVTGDGIEEQHGCVALRERDPISGVIPSNYAGGNHHGSRKR
jgi:hypothetical protein